jgi:hypothetical protein
VKTHLHLYPKGIQLFSCRRRLLKNDILYILSSGSVINDTLAISTFRLRFIFFTVCTVSVAGITFNIISLMESKLTGCEGRMIQRYSVGFTYSFRRFRIFSVADLIRVIFWATTHKSWDAPSRFNSPSNHQDYPRIWWAGIRFLS